MIRRKEKKERKPISIIMNVMAVIAVAVIIYIAVNTDFGLIWSHIRELPLALFVLLLGLQVVTQLSLNYQWFRLCKTLGLKASFLRLFAVNSYGVLVDAANPGEKVGGEVARVIQLNNMMGFSTSQSTSLVTIQKALSLSSLVILNIVAVVTLSANVSFLSNLSVRLLLIALLVAIGLLLIYALFFTKGLNARVQRIKTEGKIALWIKNWMAGFVRDTETIGKKPREWFFQFALSLGIWVLYPIKLYVIVSRHTDINLFVLFAITFISYFAAMIPLLPGGLGTFEAAMSGMLAVYGLTAPAAMAISLVFRFITFWFVVLLSGIVILFWKTLQFTRKVPS